MNYQPNEIPSIDSQSNFCKKCGKPLGDSKFCTKCGTPRDGSSKASFSHVPSAVNSFDIDCIKAFFSNNPMNAVQNAVNGRYLWLLAGLLGCLLASLGSANSILRSIVDIVMDLSDDYYGAYGGGNIYSMEGAGKAFWEMMLIMLIIHVANFFISAGIAKISFRKADECPSYVQLMNINAIANLPKVLGAVAAFLVSYIHGLLGLAVLIAGTCLTVSAKYFGYQKVEKFNSSPYWDFSAVMVLDAVCVVAIPWIIIQILT